MNTSLKALYNRLRNSARDLRAANSGNITVIFALSIVPMVGLVGAAVDYSNANSVKAAMQAASDATALMLAKYAPTTDAATLQTKANDYFKAIFNRPEANGVTITAAFNPNANSGSQVVVTASGNVKTNFTGLMGVPSMKVGVQSYVNWGNTKLRVALVLDTTGSMADDGKIGALKTATKNLIDQLKGASNNSGDVYVSLIPFSKDVNVGKSNYNASWIDWTDWNADNGDDVSTTVCTKNGRRTRCSTSTSWVPDNHNTWNGCVTDRGLTNQPHSQNWDTIVSPPVAGNTASQFPAEQYDSCPAQMMPLTYDWTGLKSLADSLYPAGNTNQGIGIAHGWQSLVGGGPYPTPPAEDSRYKYTKAIVLMSDGLNTEDRWYTNQNQIDGRESMTCTNAKAAGIVIYTVQVNTGGDASSTVLKNCASGTDKFTEIKTANQLVSTFNSIGVSLSNLRIAQ
jgi:Flp pilus assembly protein TadG